MPLPTSRIPGGVDASHNKQIRRSLKKRLKEISGYLGVLSALGSIKSCVESLRFSPNIAKIQSTETVPICDLRSILEHDDKKLVIVHGIVSIKPSWQSYIVSDHFQAIKSSSYQGKFDCVALQATFCVRNPNHFWGQVPVLRVVNRAMPFAISSRGGCVIVNNYHFPAVTHPVPFTSIFRHPLLPKVHPLGLLEEMILPLGKEITAIGMVSCRHGTYPQIDSCPDLPYFLSDMTKEEMIQDLVSSRYPYLWTAVVLGTVSIALLSYALHGNWKSVRNWMCEIIWDAPPDSPDALLIPTYLDNEDEDRH